MDYIKKTALEVIAYIKRYVVNSVGGTHCLAQTFEGAPEFKTRILTNLAAAALRFASQVKTVSEVSIPSSVDSSYAPLALSLASIEAIGFIVSALFGMIYSAPSFAAVMAWADSNTSVM